MPMGLEPSIDVLPQNLILQYQNEPDEEEYRKDPSEWMSLTIHGEEECKRAANEMACLGNPLLEKWESFGADAPDVCTMSGS